MTDERDDRLEVEELSLRLGTWLDGLFTDVERRDDGSFHIPHFGTAALDVYVEKVFGGRYTRVRVDATVLVDVDVNTKLLKYVGERSDDFVFGHLCVIRDDNGGSGRLVFRHTLLGDALDEVELALACQVTALTADDLDETLAEMFGGRLYVEEE